MAREINYKLLFYNLFITYLLISGTSYYMYRTLKQKYNHLQIDYASMEVMYEFVKYQNNYTEIELENIKQNLIDNCNMFYDSGKKYNNFINGVYFTNKYYCVWTHGRDYCDIMESDPNLNCINMSALHELTHAMITQYWKGDEHFLAKYCNK